MDVQSFFLFNEKKGEKSFLFFLIKKHTQNMLKSLNNFNQF